MREAFKYFSYVFGFISFVYSFFYIKEYGFGYFIQLTTAMGMFQGAFILALWCFLLMEDDEREKQ